MAMIDQLAQRVNNTVKQSQDNRSVLTKVADFFTDDDLDKTKYLGEVSKAREDIWNSQIMPKLKAAKANDATVSQAYRTWSKQVDDWSSSNGFKLRQGQSINQQRQQNMVKKLADTEKSGSTSDKVAAKAKVAKVLTGTGLKSVQVGGLRAVGSLAQYVADVGDTNRSSKRQAVANYVKRAGDEAKASNIAYQDIEQNGSKVSKVGLMAGEQVAPLVLTGGVAGATTKGALALGAGVKGAAAAGIGASTAVSYTQNYGDVRQGVEDEFRNATANQLATSKDPNTRTTFNSHYTKYLKKGLSQPDAAEQARLDTISDVAESYAEDYGKLVTALEPISAGAGKFGVKLAGGVAPNLVGKLATRAEQRAIGQAVRGQTSKVANATAMTKSATSAIGRSAAEEGAQEGLTDWASQKAAIDNGIKDKNDWGQTKEAAVYGAILGGLFGGGANIATGQTGYQQAKSQLSQIQQTQAATNAQLNTLQQQHSQLSQVANPTPEQKQQIQAIESNIRELETVKSDNEANAQRLNIPEPVLNKHVETPYSSTLNPQQAQTDNADNPAAPDTNATAQTASPTDTTTNPSASPTRNTENNVSSNNGGFDVNQYLDLDANSLEQAWVNHQKEMADNATITDGTDQMSVQDAIEHANNTIAEENTTPQVQGGISGVVARNQQRQTQGELESEMEDWHAKKQQLRAERDAKLAQEMNTPDEPAIKLMDVNDGEHFDTTVIGLNGEPFRLANAWDSVIPAKAKQQAITTVFGGRLPQKLASASWGELHPQAQKKLHTWFAQELNNRRSEREQLAMPQLGMRTVNPQPMNELPSGNDPINLGFGNNQALTIPDMPVKQQSSNILANSAPSGDLFSQNSQDSQASIAAPKDVSIGADGQPKWFSTAQKANEFIAKKKIGDTHHVMQTDNKRFEILPKAEQAQTDINTTTDQQVGNQDNTKDKVSDVEKLIGIATKLGKYNQKNTDIILKSDGKPFPTLDTLERAIKNRKLDVADYDFVSEGKQFIGVKKGSEASRLVNSEEDMPTPDYGSKVAAKEKQANTQKAVIDEMQKSGRLEIVGLDNKPKAETPTSSNDLPIKNIGDTITAKSGSTYRIENINYTDAGGISSVGLTLLTFKDGSINPNKNPSIGTFTMGEFNRMFGGDFDLTPMPTAQGKTDNQSDVPKKLSGGLTYVGDNKDGTPLYEDDEGYRVQQVTNGLRNKETSTYTSKGIRPERRTDEFLTAEELKDRQSSQPKQTKVYGEYITKADGSTYQVGNIRTDENGKVERVQIKEITAKDGKIRGGKFQYFSIESLNKQFPNIEFDPKGNLLDSEKTTAPKDKKDMFDNVVNDDAIKNLGKDDAQKVLDMFDGKGKDEQSKPKTDTEKFADNKVFTADKVAAARARMKSKLSQLNSGLDPELMMDGMTIAGAYIESGVRKFGDYASAMIEDFGGNIKPYLLSFWESARHFPGLDTDGMTSVEDSKKEFDALIAKSDNEVNTEQDNTDDNSLRGTPRGRTTSATISSENGEETLAGVSPDDVSAVPKTGDTSSQAGRSSADSVGRDGAPRGNGLQGLRGAGNRPATVYPTDTRAVSDGRVGEGRLAQPAPTQAVTADNTATDYPIAPPQSQDANQDNSQDFTITEDDDVGKGGLKTKFKQNLEAIKLLKQLQRENRQATKDEQKILTKWVGWGGLKAAFRRGDGSTVNGWAKEVEQLEALLTPDELSAALNSTIAAHYTEPKIVKAMWKAVEKLGFNGGRVLEPSIGSGIFLGMLPASLRKSTAFYGTELDTITGGLAQQLYPTAAIKVMGFQDYSLQDGFFKVAIGNPPFANIKITDLDRKHLSGLSLHNYFFAKSLDALEDNGVLAMVVTSRLLDGADPKTRNYLFDNAELLMAVRLPNNAFKENANTDVTTDIILLRKRSEAERINGITNGFDYRGVGKFTDKNGDVVPLNNYFIKNPDHMLGEFGNFGTMYARGENGIETALVAPKGQNTLELLNKVLDKLPTGVITKHNKSDTLIVESMVKNIPEVKVGSMFEQDGNIYERTPDSMGDRQAVAVELPSQKAVDRVTGLIGLRSILSDVRQMQLSSNTDETVLEQRRAELNKAYDQFVKEHGHINSDANKRLFKEDPSWSQLSALEDNYDKGISPAVSKNTGESVKKPSAKKAAILERRTQYPFAEVTQVSSAKDGMIETLNSVGRLDLARISQLYGKDEQAVIKELGDLIYQDPVQGWVTADNYLSGNVKAKLAQAKEAMAQYGSEYERNVKALEQVQPQDIEAVDIEVRPGAHWIPANHITDFLKDVLGATGLQGVPTYSKFDNDWTLPKFSESAEAGTQFGTNRKSVRDIVTAAMNGKQVTVYDQIDRDTKVVNQEATNDANQKVEAVKRAWNDWIWMDDNRRDELAGLYNDIFNTDINQTYDGSHLKLLGKVDDNVIELRPTQKNAIWRITQNPTTLLDHVVGAGKTFTMVAAAMELRRMGLASKPMIVVPNHLVGQWGKEFIQLYPNANILVATKKDFEAANRKRLVARIANGDWDAVIVAHSSFGKIAVSPEFEAEFIKQQIQEITTAIEDAKKDAGKSSNARDLANRRLKLEEKYKKLTASENRDTDNLYWDELGVDALMLDEAHEFKNLAYTTSSMNRVAGLGNQSGSQKAMDLFMKIQQLKQNPSSRIVFATGTPISNSMAEMYTMQRYLDMDRMKNQGIAGFDAWAKTFGEVVNDWELSASGKYQMKSRFAKFVNMPELMQSYLGFADVINRDDINDSLKSQGKKLPVPKIKGGAPQNTVVERSDAQADFIGVPRIENGREIYGEHTLIYRAEHLPKGQDAKKKGADNMLKIIGEARKAALDMRILDPNAQDFAGSKVNKAVENIMRIWRDTAADKGTQLVFCDLSTPKGSNNKEQAKLNELVRLADEGNEDAIAQLEKYTPDELDAIMNVNSFSVYDDIKQKLINQGIPENEIAFIHDANTELQKDELFSKVRSGRIRVLLGSTSKMGAGTNVQTRLVALHHMDAPWRPSDLEQREGRIIRQGNELYAKDPENFEVEIHRYATEQTMDAMQWQIIENKAKFIEQVRKGDIKTRVIEDIEGEAANAGAMKAAASGNPLILEEMALKKQLNDLDSDKTRHDREQHRIKATIKRTKDGIDSLENEQSRYTTLSQAKTPTEFDITVNGKNYKQGQEGARADAGKAIISQAIKASMSKNKLTIGQYGDFTIYAAANPTNRDSAIISLGYQGESIAIEVKHNDPAGGIITKLINRIKEIPDKLQQFKTELEKSIKAIPKLESQLKPWGKEAELDDIRRKHADVMDALKPKKDGQPQPTDKPQYSKRELLAPNGKPSNLTPEQYAQVRTKEFKAWFGDWENDPKNASKVVDENGEPMVVYHGTTKPINTFNTKDFGALLGKGSYFTTDKAEAAQYSQDSNIIASFINIKNPRYANSVMENIPSQAEMAAQGFDGVILNNDNKVKWAIAHNPNQIKSATNNTGAFDPNNDDIRYSKNTKGATDTTPTQVRDTLVKQFGEKTIKALEDAGVLHIKQLSDFVDENGNLSIADDAEGFFHDGKAVLIADNIDANQIVPVFLHEVGGHAGLQNMLSPNAYANLMQTFDAMVARGDEIALRAKARAELASENQDQATTEYLPYLLSEISNAQAKTPFIKRLLDRFVGAVRAWLYTKTGVRMNLTHADILGLAELTINERARNIERTAKLIKQANKQYSQPATNQSIDDVNKTFNDELKHYVAGKLNGSHVFKLGYPNQILKSTGFPNQPIELRASKLSEKANTEWHKFDIAEVKDLPKALEHPLAVFYYYNQARNVITQIEVGGKQLLVGIHFTQNSKGIEINDIRGLFPKDNHEWLNWITESNPKGDSKLMYVDKQKIQALIDQQRTNLAEVEYLDLDLVESIVQKFENVNIPSYSRRFAPIQQSPIPNKPAAKKAADWLNLQWATKWVSWDTFSRLIRRNIATPQHVAITHADYKKFWDLVQQRINYTNYEAANAVGLVPEILDKRLIIGQNKKDIEAVSKVIFDGTMNDIVYGDTELTRKGLTDKQIDLYRRVRQAIDESVEKMAIDVLANSAKGTGLVSLDEILRIKEAVVATGGNVHTFNTAMQQAVNAKIQAMQQAGVIDAVKAAKLTTMFGEVAKQMDSVADRVISLQDEGYAPLMRFGSYAVAVNDSKGDLVLYELYETKREQQKALHDLKKNPDYAGMTFNQNVLNPGDYQQFTNKGLNPETVMLFANELGLSSDEANQAYLKVAIAQQSALKRLIHRKKVAGFSEDLPRVLSAFVMSNARHSSRMLYNGDIQKAQQAIKDGDLRGEAQNLFENMENPKEEFASFRSMMFHWNMGFSPAFGLLNMTQPFIQTIPQLTIYDGVIGAHKSVLNGIRKAMASQVLEDAKGLGIAKNAKDFVDTIPSYMRDDYIRMTKEGHLDPQNVWLLQGLERGKAGVASGALGMVGQAAGYISEATETINRRATMYAALEIAHKLGAAKLKAKGFDSAYDFAVTTIQQTQGVYNKGNRSGLARSTGAASKFGAVIMMYKQFSINLIEQQIRMGQQKQGKALATAWVYQWLIAGSMGLIAADDLKDLIETIAFKFGYALNSERKIQEFFINSFGKDQGNDLYQMFMYGIPSAISPIDFHGRSSAGNLIPASGILHPANAKPEDRKAVAMELLGVGSSWVGNMFDAAGLMMNGQFRDAMVTAAPRYIRDSVQAYEIATTGSMRDKNGRKVMDMTQGDAVAKALQFNPKSNAQRGREAMSNWQDKKLIENVKGDFTVKLAEAIASKDQAAQDKVMADIDKWNAKNDKQYQMDKTKITKSATDKAKKRDFTADERQTLPKSLEEYVNSLKKTG